MIYKKFYFRNYKGIKNKLEFNIDIYSKKPYCIVGNNESGKTTILRGLEFINRLCKGEEPTQEEINKIHKKDLYFTGDVEVGAILEFEKENISEIDSNLSMLLSPNNEISISYIFHFEDIKYIDKKITIQLNKQFIDEKLHKSVFNIVKLYAQDILYYDDFMFSIPNVIRFCPNGMNQNDPENIYNSKNNINWKNIFNDILTGSSHKNDDKEYKIRNFQTDVIDFKDNSGTEEDTKKARVDRMGTYLTKLLSNWIEKNISSDIKNIQINQIKSKGNFIDYKISIMSKKDDSYDMSERSKGLQWTFCFNILTNIRKERHNNGFIFLLDEPASNLHVSLQGKMLEEMNKMCNDKNLVIYSTHAPDLIDLSNNSNWFFVKNNAKELEETNITLSKDIADEIIVMPIISKITFNSIITDSEKDKKINKSAFEKIKDVCKESHKIIEKIGNKLSELWEKTPEPIKKVITDKITDKITDIMK